MARVKLSETRDWELVDSDHDLRDWTLWDAHGHELGKIEDMVIDTDTERVVSVLMPSGDEYPARDLSIGDDAVYVLNYDAAAEPPPSRRRYSDQGVRRRPTPVDGFRDRSDDYDSAPHRDSDRGYQSEPPRVDDRDRDRDRDRDFDSHHRDRDREYDSASRRDDRAEGDRRTYADFTDDFRRHYDHDYGDRGRDFSDWEPAYRFGYDMAYETEYAGRDFDAAEEDLRRDFYRRMGYPMSDRHVWDDVRGAVRHAFERSRSVERQV